MRYLICPLCNLRGVAIFQADITQYACRLCEYTTSIANTIQLQSAQTDRKRSPRVAVKLSEQAWTWHIQTAKRLGYIRSLSNDRNISIFVAMLSTLEFTDTRPEFMQHTDQWHAGDILYTHRFKLGPNTQTRLATHAARHTIRPYLAQARVVRGSTDRVDALNPLAAPGALCGPVLEAIGLRWLTQAPHTPLVQAPPGLWLSKQVAPKLNQNGNW